MTTDTLRAAAQAALDALEAETDPSWDCNSYHPKIAHAITALRAALAVPAGCVVVPVEGVAWGLWGEGSVSLIQRGTEDDQIARKGGERLYRLAAAPAAQPTGRTVQPTDNLPLAVRAHPGIKALHRAALADHLGRSGA